jgi:hypothetical protein
MFFSFQFLSETSQPAMAIGTLNNVRLFLYAIEEKKISGNIDELSQKFVKNPAN